MKLIIQIPCFNESEHLPETVAALPTQVEGFNTVEYLVIDDGSSDDTSSVAKKCGVHHVVSHRTNKGLARAFETGLDTALKLGADVIVNTDADNQYCADDIPTLTKLILEGTAELVIGARPIQSIEHFSPIKKALQALGSAAVRQISNSDVQDAPSGFRAYSRDAAMRIHVFSDYTYTLETIIQAGQSQMAIASVPIRVNGPTRPSRLVKSIPSYVKRSLSTMVRIYITYRPLRFFGTIGTALLIPGVLLSLRFLFYYFTGSGQGHIQSLILTAILFITGLLSFSIGILADLISVNRKLNERSSYQTRQKYYNQEDKFSSQ